MVQVLKEEVRQRIRRAALAEFAASGVARATIGAIAQRAEIGAATLYGYYASKDALLLDVIPAELAEEFESTLERRVRALAFVPSQPDGDFGAASSSAQEILEFWLRHRLEVVVLLDRAEGTVYADFGQRFVKRLTELSLSLIRAESPKTKVSSEERLVLSLIFENTRRTLATLLERGRSERAIREAFAAFWAYQLPGLRGFAQSVIGREARRTRR